MFESFFHKDSHKEAQDAYAEFEGARARGEHQGHPKTAAAVAFMAMKAYDHHAKKEGKQPLGTMKELAASFAVAEIDKLVEERAIPAAEARWHKEQAIKHCNKMAEERHGAEFDSEY